MIPLLHSIKKLQTLKCTKNKHTQKYHNNKNNARILIQNSLYFLIICIVSIVLRRERNHVLLSSVVVDQFYKLKNIKCQK